MPLQFRIEDYNLIQLNIDTDLCYYFKKLKTNLQGNGGGFVWS